MNTTYTTEQIKNFTAYEAVRKSGKFNMYDRRAIERTGLDSKAYFFVMKNYTELKAAQAVAA